MTTTSSVGSLIAAGNDLTSEWFRTVMGTVPTSVAVVSGLDSSGRPVGLAVGTLTSVSLDPPLVAFCPGLDSSSWPKIRPSGRFCVNVLARSQEHVSRLFASKRENKFTDVDWAPSQDGLPMIEGTVARIECVLQDEHDGGDHTIVVGRVVRMTGEPAARPRVFLGGKYGEVG